jgi:hypothetical protein
VAFGRRGARGRAARAPITWPSRPVASGLPGVPAAMASKPCGHAGAGRSSPMPSSWARSPRSATGSSDMFMRQPSWNQRRSVRWWNPGRPSRRHAAAALPAAPRRRGEAPRSSQGRIPTQSPGIASAVFLLRIALSASRKYALGIIGVFWVLLERWMVCWMSGIHMVLKWDSGILPSKEVSYGEHSQGFSPS